MKKYRALELVSKSIGQSVDTIRDWEKGAKFDEDYSNELKCAELAGRYCDKFQNFDELPLGFPDHGTYRGKPLMQIAFDLAKVIERQFFPRSREYPQISSELSWWRASAPPENWQTESLNIQLVIRHKNPQLSPEVLSGNIILNCIVFAS